MYSPNTEVAKVRMCGCNKLGTRGSISYDSYDHVGHFLLASSSWMGVSVQDQGTSGFQTRSESLLSTGNETTPLILTPKKSRRNTQKT